MWTCFLKKNRSFLGSYRSVLSLTTHGRKDFISDNSKHEPLSTSPKVSLESSSHTPQQIAKILENDQELLSEVIYSLSPSSRRKLIIAGGAMEWFGREHVAREVSRADEDNDRVISPKDFDNWFASALRRTTPLKSGSPVLDIHQMHQVPGIRHTGIPEKSIDQKLNAECSISYHSSDQGKPDHISKKDVNQDNFSVQPGSVSFRSLCLVAIEAGLPFVGFGCLDNATMIVAGDAIDKSLGVLLHCSVLASAALGNVVSGVLGMQVHGMIDRMVHLLPLRLPTLNETQRKDPSVFFAGHIGGTIGITIGLILGMFPLFFINGSSRPGLGSDDMIIE